jgi:peptidoglycan/xylan/chitin deacetylase (PgdA/CDA1 family)
VVGRRKVLLGLAALGGGFGAGLLLEPREVRTPAVVPTTTPAATEVIAVARRPEAAIATPTPVPLTTTPRPPPPTAVATPWAVPTARTVPSPVPTRAATPTAAAPAVLPEISRVTTSRQVVALTFDAGADKGATTQTLELLRDRGVRATFFVTGRFAELFPGLIKQMVADGHELANHTYDHKDLVDLTGAQIAAELERTDAILRGFTGVSTRPLMRAPFGSRDARVRAAIAAAGYRSIYWAIDAGDWKPGATPGAVAAAVRKAVAGDVVVQHCSTAPTATALPTILTDLGRRGLAVATVSGLLAG